MAQPTTKKVEEKTEEQQMKERAITAAIALRDFITTGDRKSSTEFLSLWNKYNANDAFYGQLGAEINKHPEIIKLSKAYEAHAKVMPSAEDLVTAVERCYEELKKPRGEQDTKLLAQFGTSFVSEMRRMVTRYAIPRVVTVPPRVDDKTLNQFIDLFSVSVSKEASKKDRMEALVKTVVDRFKAADFAEGQEITRGMIDAYLSTEKEERKAFVEWVKQLDKKQNTELVAAVRRLVKARRLNLSYEAMQTAFVKWQMKRGAKKEEISKEEKELEDYPVFVKEGKLTSMVLHFVSKPNGYRLDIMERRLEYLRKKSKVLERKTDEKSKKEIQNIKNEIETLQTWLSDVGIAAKSPEGGLGALKAGMLSIQADYNRLDFDSIIRNLQSISSKKELYSIYTTYLSWIDARVARILVDLDPALPDYLENIRHVATPYATEKKILRGQANWHNEYYRYFAPKRPERISTRMEQAEEQMFSRIGQLNPLAAIAFNNYLETVSRAGVAGMAERRIAETATEAREEIAGQPEKRLVVQTAAQLEALHPLLVAEYFSAITNIADICEDNPDAFREALTVIAARVDKEAGPIVSRFSPAQMNPMNVRTVVNRLDGAFEELINLKKSALANYDRLNLMDDLLLIRPYPPHSIEHKPPGYAQSMLVDREWGKGYYTPSPFPHYLLTPIQRSFFSSGAVYNQPFTYAGSVKLPAFRPLTVYSGATSVGAAMKAYLDEQHPFVSLHQHLPGTLISPLSPTRLMNEINRAFIPTDRPEYSWRLASGGLGGGLTYLPGWEGLESQLEGGGLGSLITPTGGLAIGAAVRGEERVFAGATAIAVPIGKFVGKEIGIASMVGGYELHEDTQQIVARAISTQWNPENPSEIIVAVNQEEDVEGRTTMTARYFYVDKEGTIFDIKGGENDFVEVLNFLAGYANEQFMTPTTYAWDVEPTMERGGGALVFDIGKTAWLAHTQAVPFILPEGTPQPFLLQWTGAGAVTVKPKEEGEVGIYRLSIPGTMLRLKSGTDGSKEEDYIIQDVEYMMRQIEGRNGWELTVGGGYAETPTGKRARGGAFVRVQKPRYKVGGGLFYEAGATNLEALALFHDAEDTRRYIESLHRIGVTAYGSAMVTDRIVLGALAHIVPQFKEDLESGEVSPDNLFYRVVGLLRGLKDINPKTDWGARFGVSRAQGLDRMMMEYEQLGRNVGRDPQRAQYLINNFRTKYADEIKQIFDHYSLGVIINEDFSLEAILVAKEDENKFEQQVPERIHGKVLYTWRTGFWRAFASVPLVSSFGLESTEKVGMVGTGIGSDLLNGLFLQRAAADVGLLLARRESGEDLEKWVDAGFFTQGAIRVFSNVVEDSQQYRKLLADDAGYRTAIYNGAFSKIPKKVRDAICKGLPDAFPKELKEKISKGESAVLSVDQRNAIETALWTSWFYEEKFNIEREFNGHVRAFLAANAYFFSDKTYWDIGTFVEYVDDLRGEAVKGYVIGAQREKFGVFAGIDYQLGRWKAGAVAGVTEDGKFGAAASVGLRYTWRGMPVEIGVSGFGRSDEVPSYAMPLYRAYQYAGRPELGVIFYLTLGQTGPIVPLAVTPTPTYEYR